MREHLNLSVDHQEGHAEDEGHDASTLHGLLLCLLMVFNRPLLATAEPTVEWDFDAYGDGSLTMNHDVTITGYLATPVTETFSDVSFNPSVTGGGRVGFWFLPRQTGWTSMGMGLDVVYFSANVDAQTVSATETISSPLRQWKRLGFR